MSRGCQWDPFSFLHSGCTCHLPPGIGECHSQALWGLIRSCSLLAGSPQTISLHHHVPREPFLVTRLGVMCSEQGLPIVGSGPRERSSPSRQSCSLPGAGRRVLRFGRSRETTAHRWPRDGTEEKGNTACLSLTVESINDQEASEKTNLQL